MKVKYIKEHRHSEYDAERFFTTGKEYEVLADYRQRESCQGDNGFVVIDNQGQENMLFENEIQITNDDKTNVYVFKYNY